MRVPPLFWEDEQLESLAGKSLSNLMLLNCFEQLINEPTHFPRGEIETCLDLILTDKPSAFVHCGVIPSPDPRCKHQIVNGIINFSVPTPPPYKRRIWKYDQANIPLIKRDFSLIDWDFCFRGASLDEMVSIFSEKILSIASIHIPNEHKTFNDKDAPWVTPKVKCAVTRNHRVYKKWKDRGKPSDGRAYVKIVQSATSNIIEEAKKSYLDKLSDKLSNPKSNSNIFWSAFKRILNCKICLTSHLSSKMVFFIHVFLIKPIFSTSILLCNVLLFKMIVPSPILCLTPIVFSAMSS